MSQLHKTLKSDPNITKRTTMSKPHEIFNSFYNYKNLIDPMKNLILINEAEIQLIDRVKQNFLKMTETQFIDELFFLSFNRLRKFKLI